MSKIVEIIDRKRLPIFNGIFGPIAEVKITEEQILALLNGGFNVYDINQKNKNEKVKLNFNNYKKNNFTVEEIKVEPPVEEDNNSKIKTGEEIKVEPPVEEDNNSEIQTGEEEINTEPPVGEVNNSEIQTGEEIKIELTEETKAEPPVEKTTDRSKNDTNRSNKSSHKKNHN